MKTNHTLHKSIYLYILACIFIVSGCKKNDDVPSDESWVRIYDHSDYNLIFYPLDAIELENKNFVILSGNKYDTLNQEWTVPFIIGTDKNGIAQWTTEVGTPYVSPVQNIININGELFFFCMDNTTLGTHILKIDLNGSQPALVKSFDDLLYPLYVRKTENNEILLTGYDRLDRSTTLTCFDNNFNLKWSQKYSVIEDAEEKVIFHLTHRGQEFQFFTGDLTFNAQNYYFVNGFYNFSFSLLFVNPSNGDVTGLVNGYSYESGSSSLIQRNDTNFILSRFDEGQSFINTNAPIDFNDVGSIDGKGGVKWAEIDDQARVVSLNAKINGKKSVILGTSTRSNQALILFFDPETGELDYSKYLGSTQPVSVASVSATKEGGLAVLTRTFAAGRFARAQLFKIPKQDLEF